ncbi:carbohydrate ABC transporter membrane protein 2 (CUT1 family) [Knoellia remsis]|uniref:Carbohydrate ABC transporter membrane protein 2 (CUT1 family) n=1 Tax=Knoellia remsis TaxID=407159 RepID=A0A2T0UK03_9MICO|nr:carbohydrate ABC transporter permease [Knoellia remsis]PRY58263.1 carbohydrate ABC transporter membrane protein 2 (CUT1 family) [Knoellia remsis]
MTTTHASSDRRAWSLVRWVVLAVLTVAAVFPFYYMLMLSFVPIESLLLDPGRIWVAGQQLTTETYRTVLASTENEGQGFGLFLRNSAIVATACMVITLLISIPGAYAVARLPFMGRRTVSALFLSVYLFPTIVLAVPLFIAFAKVGLQSSLVGLMLVYVVQTIPVSIYMLRTYFETIPETVEEAAEIDGAGRFATMRHITLPLAMPSILSTGLYVFMIAWNEFLFALLFLAAQPERWTVSLGLAQLSNGIEVPKTVLMAGSVILTVPIIVLYSIAERALTEGLTAGADKG